ncbi:MAG: HD domain-containing protein [Methanobrevibacter sp.]|jgi:uncharacterized protein|nr:HD domain-containing protein [Methanobrevibacter sp.]
MDKKIVEEFVQGELIGDRSGHDFMHVQRVVNMSLKLANQFICDMDIVLLSAYLHDIIDDKVVDDVNKVKILLNEKLEHWNMSFSKRCKIFEIIEHISFSKNLEEKYKLPIEGQVVQDADRLDAIGAIGIARAFYYGGHVCNPMHDTNFSVRNNLTENSYREENTITNHFHEKLLKLEGLMNTKIAKNIAKERTVFMYAFLKRFYREWNSEE